MVSSPLTSGELLRLQPSAFSTLETRHSRVWAIEPSSCFPRVRYRLGQRIVPAPGLGPTNCYETTKEDEYGKHIPEAAVQTERFHNDRDVVCHDCHGGGRRWSSAAHSVVDPFEYRQSRRFHGVGFCPAGNRRDGG